MAFCKNCGEIIQDGDTVCQKCGAVVIDDVDQGNQEIEETQAQQPEMPSPVEQAPIEQEPEQQEAPRTEPNKFNVIIDEFNNTDDVTDEIDEEDIRNNKVLAVLAYIGILVLVPIFVAPDSKFARFHASQGLTLFVCRIVYTFVMSIVSGIFMAISFTLGQIVSSILSLVYLFFLVLFILGIINAIQGKAKELPFIGKIKILK